MKAIVINPKEKTITESDIADHTLDDFYRIIGCDYVEIVRLGATPGQSDEQVVVIDEEGLLKNPEYFTRLGDLPLAGTLVLVGEKEGPDGVDLTDTGLSLDYVKMLFEAKQFDWLDPEDAAIMITGQTALSAEEYRAAGWEVDPTGEFGFIATIPTKKMPG